MFPGSMAQEGLTELQQVCEMHMWEQRELMPRNVQFQLFADCTGLLTTTDIIVDREWLEAWPQNVKTIITIPTKTSISTILTN